MQGASAPDDIGEEDEHCSGVGSASQAVKQGGAVGLGSERNGAVQSSQYAVGSGRYSSRRLGFGFNVDQKYQNI